MIISATAFFYSWLILLGVSLGQSQVRIPPATWGPYVEMGFTKSEFVKLSTIYTPGYPPANNKGTIFLWPGVWDRRDQNKADLVQTVTEYYGSATKNENTCSPKPGEWVSYSASSDRNPANSCSVSGRLL